jgi:hypothetical protein
MRLGVKQYETSKVVNSMSDTSCPRLVHLHIPKTAGTALRSAFQRHFEGKMRIFPHWEEAKIAAANPQEYDFFSGHIGFTTASKLEADIVTVLRNPVDRYISVYYFWRQLFEAGEERTFNTELAHKYSLDEFVQIRDQPNLLEEFENRSTYQIAFGSSLLQRRKLRQESLSSDDIFKLAIGNIHRCKAVGIQEDMSRFVGTILKQYGVSLTVEKINVTKARATINDVSIRTRRIIQDWVYMDIELYQEALRMA